jgi:hypothetical protein
MATTTPEKPSTTTATLGKSSPPNPPAGYSHQFHAEAHVLSGELRAPIKQTVEKHAPVALQDERGGHLTRFTEDASIEGLIHFRTGHTRVSGSKSQKHEAWVTLSTSVLEGLNVFEVITADRVVAQVSTEHPYVHGHVPSVTFLGSKFENLQVCGIPVEITLNLGVCGERPKDEKSYLTNLRFLTESLNQVEEIADCGFLPREAKKQYDERRTQLKNLIDGKGGCKVTCSLVASINIEKVRKQIPGVKTIGNVIVIPDFGAVSLGEVEVGVEDVEPSSGYERHTSAPNNGKTKLAKTSNYFEVTMLNMELGCVGDGSLKVAKSKTNGTTNP